MKTFLKNIQSTGLVLITGLIMANALLAQDLPVTLNGGDITTALDPHVAGTDYHYTVTPQEPIDGDVVWEIANINDLDDAGLQMAFGCPTSSYSEPDCSVFDLTTPIADRTFTPDGNVERLHFVPDPAVTPITNERGDVYQIELLLSDDSNTVEITLDLTVERRPVSVVFVLDKSGSMNSFPHGASGPIKRIDILRSAASLFINKLNAFNQESDEGALTYFDSDVDNPAPGFGVALTPIESNAGNFTDEIESNRLDPGGSTAMGEGLLEGKDKLSSVTEDNRQFIFLFTDGEQNAGRQVDEVTGDNADGEPLNNTDGSIQIMTVGTGAAAGLGPALLLQKIAEVNNAGGTARYFLIQEEVDPLGPGSDFNTAVSISNFFDEGFQSMLSGGSPQTVGVQQGTMPSQTAVTEDFEINANIEKVLFELITPDREPFFTIEKDGASVNDDNASITFISGPNNGVNSLLAVVDLADQPASGIISEGTWSINIQSGTGGGQPYQIKAQVDDHRLNYTFEAGADDFKVEDVLRLNADIAYDNTPLEDANISALVFKPGEDLGDLLARADVKFDADTAGDNGSVGYQKLLALIEDKPALIDSLNLQENTVNLAHTADGNYEAQFSDTDVSGAYQVIARISGASDSTGNYERLLRRTVYLRFGDPDPEISIQEYSQTGANAVQLLYTPMYAVDGNPRFVGPGFANGISVTGTDVSKVVTLDNGDGSYTINLDVRNRNTDPDIKINLSGVDVYEGQASDFSDTGNVLDDFKDWLEKTFGISLWLFLVILLLIFVIIWGIKKS
jgi:hypothetical protein